MAERMRAVELVLSGRVDRTLPGAFGKAQSGLKRYKQQMEGVDKQQRQVRQSAGLMGGSLVRLVGTLGLVAGAAAAVRSGFETALNLEQTTIGFEVMLKSASKAKQMLKGIYEFSAETPFEFPEIAESTRSLLAFGVSGDEVSGKIRMLANISAGLQIPLNELAVIYGKNRSQGRMYLQDLNELAGRGIPVVAGLSKMYGKNAMQIREMVSKGKIGFPQIEKVLQSLTNKGGLFYGMIDKQSKSMGGLWSTLKDNLNMSMAEFIGRYAPQIKAWLKWAIQNSGKLTKVLDSLAVILTATGNIVKWVIEHWSQLKPVIIAVVGAVATYKTVMLGLAVYDVFVAIKAGWAGIAIATNASTAAAKAYRLAALASAGGPFIVILATVGAAIAAVLLWKRTIKEAMGWWDEYQKGKRLRAEGIEADKYVSEFLKGKKPSIRKQVEADARASKMGAHGGYPGRALGGPVAAARSYLVGERGPEIFTPSLSGRIVANGALAGAGMNVTFAPNITIAGNADRREVQAGVSAGFEEFKRMFGRMMREEQRRAF